MNTRALLLRPRGRRRSTKRKRRRAQRTKANNNAVLQAPPRRHVPTTGRSGLGTLPLKHRAQSRPLVDRFWGDRAPLERPRRPRKAKRRTEGTDGRIVLSFCCWVAPRSGRQFVQSSFIRPATSTHSINSTTPSANPHRDSTVRSRERGDQEGLRVGERARTHKQHKRTMADGGLSKMHGLVQWLTNQKDVGTCRRSIDRLAD